ncbi:MAG: murein biosynthesis integral membrane protein MurJ [Planctomycetia bacterium]|nr:murein biosynthesis integral membrane protein MurJ [Planctomycetia bacterium]
MANRKSWHLWGGFWTTSLGTLASRVLGLVRDMATAALLGLGEGGVMDAFVIAFRIPNLLRRVFGEGALAASFLPVFSAEFERDPRGAWQLLSALFAWLAIVLSVVVLVGEAACAALWWVDRSAGATPLLGLLSAMLPYLTLICLSAQASAALQALLQFKLPALVPTLLNVCWLAAAWGVAPCFAPDKLAQAYTIAFAVLISGVLQFVVQLPALRKAGFRFEYNWRECREAFWQVGQSMVPITLGMAVTQFNTLLDSLIAWGLSAEGGASRTIWWLGGAIGYPMQTGAAAAIYYGERFYQLPVGMLGVAIATVIYPLLSRHAARRDHRLIGADLTLALRLVWFTALPAGVGIILVAQPLTRLLFERGEFTADDAARAARMIACYASGVWAYSAIPVLVRGYYAVGNRATPARLGLIAVGVNLALNLALIWPLAEIGLAVATSIAAGVQVVLLAATFSRDTTQLAWRELGATLTKSAIAVVAMTLAVAGVEHFYPARLEPNRMQQAIHVSLFIGTGAAVYLSTAWLLGMNELRLLLVRPKLPADRLSS